MWIEFVFFLFIFISIVLDEWSTFGDVLYTLHIILHKIPSFYVTYIIWTVLWDLVLQFGLLQLKKEL